MNKLFLLILLHSFSLFICCSGLSNPFDSESSNYISDSAFVDILHHYDSTFITKSFVYDTIVHIDTVVHDSFSVTNTIHIDTILHNDTNLINVTHIDTATFFDTIFYNDSTCYIDTISFYDTIFFQETLSFFDTTFYKDTSHFQDTFFHYDTVIYYDTTIDTVRFSRTNPFLFLVDLSDSSVFSTFNYGSSYNLSIKAAGITPSIIRSSSILEPFGSFLIPHVPPWSTTYNTTSSIRYTLSVTTDSGTFSNFFSVYCDPSTTMRGVFPSLGFISVRTLTGFDTKYYYAPVCTLWTDSSYFSEYPDRIGYLELGIYYVLPGSSQLEMYLSQNGSYDTSSCALYGPKSSEFEFINELSDLSIGTHLITSKSRAVSPDTSLWSPWLTMVLFVLDGR